MRKAPQVRAAWSALALCALIAVAGCSKKEPEAAPAANESVEVAPTPEPVAPPETPPAEVVHEAPPPPEPKVPPAPEISADAQMLRDAEASGMTARLPRTDDALPAGTGNEDGGAAQ